MLNLEARDSSVDKRKYKKVYCDNDKLKGYILDAKPSKNGLYPHEIVMINRAKIRQLKTVNTVFPSLLSYQYSVLYPALLLKSLFERGFIKEATPLELLNNIGASDLRTLMKNKSLKSTGTASKENMRGVIKENYTLDEVVRFLGFNLFLPSILGEDELEENKYLTENEYGAWSLNCNYIENRYILSEDIITIDLTVQELHISQGDFICKLYGETIKGWVYNFVPGTKLNIFIDDTKVFEELPADKIYFLRNTKRIIVGQKELDNTKRKIKFTSYDAGSRKVLYTETTTDDINSTFPVEKLKKYDELNSFDGIIEGDKINYYVSINNLLAKHIMTDLFNESMNIKKLTNYLEDDDSMNYIISVNVKDTYERNLIMYMINSKLLQAPVIKSVNLHNILHYLRASNKNKTHRSLVENSVWDKGYELKIVKEVKEKCKNDWREFYKHMTKTYPKRAFLFDMFKNYSSENYYNKDINLNEVLNNKKKWDNEFKLLIEKLILNGKIAPRWINEFTLFSITLAYFTEAIYQYRDLWLESSLKE